MLYLRWSTCPRHLSLKPQQWPVWPLRWASVWEDLSPSAASASPATPYCPPPSVTVNTTWRSGRCGSKHPNIHVTSTVCLAAEKGNLNWTKFNTEFGKKQIEEIFCPIREMIWLLGSQSQLSKMVTMTADAV